MPGHYRIDANSNATATNLTGLDYLAGGYTFAFWMEWLGTGNSGGDIFGHTATGNTTRSGYTFAVSAANVSVRHLTAAAATSYVAIERSPHLDRVWTHCAITYDGSAVRGYINGELRTRTAAPNVPTTTATSTTTLQPNVSGPFIGNVFDLQIILGAFVPAQEVPLLMDPTFRHRNLRARFFGREFVGVGPSSTLRDESGNGNNLATAANMNLQISAEPPIRPTLA